MASIKMMKKQLYYDMDVVNPGPVNLERNYSHVAKDNNIPAKSSEDYIFYGKVKVDKKLLLIIGCGEVAFLAITLILTIAHFARFSKLSEKMPVIVITIVVGVAIGFFLTGLLFLGLKKDLLFTLKIHYIGHAIASSLLLTSFVFVFTSVFGAFDETYYYGERSPAIVIILGVIWGVGCPLSIFIGVIVRKYYRNAQKERKKFKKSASANGTPFATTENLETLSETSKPLNGNLANGQQSVQIINTQQQNNVDIHNDQKSVNGEISAAENGENQPMKKRGSQDTVNSADNDKNVSYDDICDKADGELPHGNDLTYEDMCNLEIAEKLKKEEADISLSVENDQAQEKKISPPSLA